MNTAKKITSDEAFILMLLTSLPMFVFWMIAWRQIEDLWFFITCYIIASILQTVVFFTIFLIKK